MKLYTALENLLKTENNFIDDDGHLKKWVIINKAQNYDAELIGLLLENEEIKAHFFIAVKDVLVFNQSLFIQFLEQKNYLKDSYTSFRNKIGLTIDGKFLNQRNEVALVWPYKDCVLEGGQSREEDKRKEIFFNEILAQDEINQLLEPKVLTNAKRFTVDGEKTVNTFNRNSEGTITDNLIIKGNNLLALHTLKEEFAGKVKLIYIDPPYNTGSDSFGYNDNFNHSTWLTFMRNRLKVAKELLREDGFLFVQCDYNEDAHLKILLEDVFGSNLFLSNITVRSNSISGNKTQHKNKTILKNKDSLLVFSKTNKIKINPQYTIKSDWDTHYNSILIKTIDGNYEIKKLKDVLIEEKIIKENHIINSNSTNDKLFYKFIFDNRDCIFRGVNSIPDDLKKLSIDNSNKVVYIEKENEKMFAYNGSRLSFLSKVFKKIDGLLVMSQLLGDLWTDVDFQNTQNEGGGVSFTNGKKPEKLIKRIIEMVTAQNEIILDYHMGSGTTCAVANKLNRQYIGIEQMDYIENIAIERLKKVIDGEQGGISKAVNWQGGGEFVYLELKKHNQDFIEKIEIAKDTKAILKIWEDMKTKSFLTYNVDIKKQDEHLEEFKNLGLEEQKQHLVSILDKNQLYVNQSNLNDKDYNLTAEEIQVTKDFYQTK